MQSEKETDDGKVADTDQYVAALKRTEKVLLEKLDGPQRQLKRYLPTVNKQSQLRWLCQ